MADILPPHSVEAEEATLGSLLIDPAATSRVAAFLRAEDFYIVKNGWIYQAILALGDKVDLLTIGADLAARNLLEEVGGESYLAQLTVSVPTALNVETYAHLVVDFSLRRRLINSAGEIARLAYDQGQAVDQVIEKSEASLFGVSDQRLTGQMVPIRKAVDEFFERVEYLHDHKDEPLGIPSGYPDLDKLTGGLQKGDLVIVAARPGVGKCVTADTRLVDPATGRLVSIEQLVRDRTANLLSLGNDYKLRVAQACDFVDDGVKPVYRVVTALGREITVTLSHPFLTLRGWLALSELRVGDSVGVPRVIPVFGSERVPDHQLKVLAYLIADGCITGRNPQFTNSNPRLRQDFADAALRFPGTQVRVEDSGGTRTPTVYVSGDSEKSVNSLTEWLQRMGIWGKAAAQKCVPDLVFRATRDGVALFLNRLFACDGSVYFQDQHPRVSYSTISADLAHGVQHLLLRFGILSKMRRKQLKYRGEVRVAYELQITDRNNVLAFCVHIGALGKEHVIDRARSVLEKTSSNTNLDTIPLDIWPAIATAKGDRSWGSVYRDMGLPIGSNIHVGRRAPSRERLLELGQAIKSPDLIELARSDVYWDKITQIEYIGERQVYDLTVPDTHNFVADDMIVHNTSLMLNVGYHAAFRHRQRVAIFSLEMSNEQLVQRFVASETGIDSQRLRVGDLRDEEWAGMTKVCMQMHDLYIFLDDTPSLSPLDLRVKARRIYQEYGLDLIIVDYLQLMQGENTSRNDNRVQEISYISRALKGIARELKVPLVAGSQLSRLVEQRSDKRPMLSDLRESGCLSGDSLVTMADTGARMPIRELAGKSNLAVWALNETTLKLERAIATRAFSTGYKTVYRMTTQLGRSIKATANHLFRTFDGWRRLDELEPGMLIALPRIVPSCEGTTESDIYWDQVSLITEAGVDEVYDLTVDAQHNFVADDIIVHNSIEQDSDIVMFIYRDEIYNPDTEFKNIAEISVSKNRNGPTGKATLYFDRRLTSFKNLAKEKIQL